VFSFLRQLSAFAAELRAAAPLLLGADACAACLMQARRAAVDDISSAGRSATNPLHAAAAVDRWDRRTDGRTDARPFHSPCSAYYAGSR